ncbi:MAG TPA: glycosyltransferase family 39 protein [Chloroflexota bacterium]
MTLTSAPPEISSVARKSTAARRVVLLVLALAGLLGAALLALSLVPSATLAARLLGAAGEARAGVYTQELSASADLRLRFAGVLVLALVGGLALLRTAFEDLVAATLRDASARPRVTAATLLLVAAPTLFALLLRVPFLAQPMRYDEALSFNEFASRPLYYGLSFYPEPNNHLLNTLLMHAVFLVAGNQPWLLRLPALVAGVLLVPATYWLARLLYGPSAAILAAVLVAASSFLVEYSTNARGYTLQALCFVVMLALAIVAARRRSLSALLLAALVAALGAYAVPTMLYGVAVVAAWLLVDRHLAPRYLVASGLILGLVTTVLYLPVIVISGPDKLAANRFVVPLAVADLPAELGHSLVSTWAFWNRDVPWLFAALLVFGFCVTVVTEIRQRRVPLALLALVVCLVLVVGQRVAPFERVWLFLLPVYLTVASAGLARFVDGRLLGLVFGGVLAYTVLTSGSILASTETGVFPDAEGVARTLAPRLAPDDAVTTQLPASLPELQYYFPRFGLPIDVLVRAPDDAQNLWVIAPPGATPSVDGWPNVTEVQRFPSGALYELRRAEATR